MFEHGHALLSRGRDRLRRVARETAELLVEIAELVASDGEFAPLEIAAAYDWTVPYTQRQVALAVALTTRFPATLAALRAGEIQEYKAHWIVEAVEVLSDAEIARIEAEIAAQAGKLKGRQLNDRLRRMVALADPEAAARRAAAKSEARRTYIDNLGDGASTLMVQNDTERVHIAHLRMREIARQIKSAGDARTLDQITSDVAVDSMCGKGFENVVVHVHLTLPATTALGVDSKPGYLAGYGWIPAQRALTMAASKDAVWQRILTDPLTGQAVDAGRRKYRPPAALRDHVRATFPTCTGPGCVRPAYLCDLDHAKPFPLGGTDQFNVGPACRSHHRAKTLGGWRIEPSEHGLTWVTKHGFRFTHEPEPIADPEPAPF